MKEILYLLETNKSSNNSFAFILIGEDSKIPLKEFVNSLNNRNIKFTGGVFPKIIHNNKTSGTGIVIKWLPHNAVSIYFDSSKTFSQQISEFSSVIFLTAYVLTSGISSESSEHLRSLYTYLGNDVKFLGGGAGRIKEHNGGVLISNDGIFNTGTIITLTENKVTTGSLHGWTKLHGPFIATKTDKNFIKELNWENAFVVYQRFLKTALDIKINRENFEDNSIHYPFGIYKENSEYIIRDPMRVTEEGYLHCVGNIPENSLIDLMTMRKEDFKSVSKNLVCQSIDKESKIADALIFNCISRANHLNNNFYVELSNLTDEIKTNQNQVNLEGALSIGEIYSSGEGYPEILNKSIVLGFSYLDKNAN
ncbi:FIST C-terminal domain-containing protein [Labilibaculum sp.]|uniref:FIST signal transduction protein n=1 Tax=Labilibaculum sp. TaxID=2060723 RepID=UPI002AA71B90|nr:FIST C-terminal domain-containing protein [Labilibaculum sp.]